MKSLLAPTKQKVIISFLLITFYLCLLTVDSIMIHIGNNQRIDIMESVNPKLKDRLDLVLEELNQNQELSLELGKVSAKSTYLRIWTIFIFPVVFSYLFACIIMLVRPDRNNMKKEDET